MGNRRNRSELPRELEEAWQRRQRDPQPPPEKLSVPRPAGAPYWVPRGAYWDGLPEGVKFAVGEVIEPAYQQLVCQARDELERAAGMTLVHLMWLEICDQAAMSTIVGDRDTFHSMVHDPQGSVDRHLHLVAAKNGTAELLLKFRTAREMLNRQAAPLGPPGSAPALPAPIPVPSRLSPLSGREPLAPVGSPPSPTSSPPESS